jgi:short-subunit dehydrogenase
MAAASRPPIDGGTILLTGASSGIGRALADLLAPRAGKLVVVARRVDRLEALAQALRARHPKLEVHVRGCDLGDVAAARALVGEVEGAVGPVDVLVNNAGLGDIGMFDLVEWERLEKMITLDCTALAALTHAALPRMMARGRGGILNISSGFGLEFMPGFSAYCACKHFVSSLTEGLRIEARPFGVVVSQACPGPVRTEFQEVAAPDFSGQKIPSFIEISAERCARDVLRGFSKGRALILPGLPIRFALALGAVTPRWLKRWVYRIVASQMRRQQEQRRAAPP